MTKTSSNGSARRRMGAASVPEQEQIALLAYVMWQKRGSPEGSPEVDWFAAECELASWKTTSGGKPLRLTRSSLRPAVETETHRWHPEP